MRDTDWRRYIYRVAIVVLVVFFVLGVGFGAKKVLTIEGVRELYTAPAPRSALPETPEDMIACVNAAVQKALADAPRTVMTSSFAVDAPSLETTDAGKAFSGAVKASLPGLNARVTELSPKATADYSASAASFLTTVGVSASDVTGAELSYEYYRCTLCTSEIAPENYAAACPECGSKDTLQLRLRDTYKITLHIAPDSPAFRENPFPKTEALPAVLAGEGEGYYALQNFSSEIREVTLYAEVNRLTDEIGYLRFQTDLRFSAELAMAGDYASLGTVTVGADARDRLVYQFTWPSVKLDKHETTVEIGSSEVLKAKLTCDDPAAYDVIWTSSDESVLTVDGQGYLKTGKTYGDSTVTATFTFRGQEYSDSCFVHVGVPAEGVDLSKGRLTLAPGQTAQLSAKFNPKDTTNTLCYWYSQDETVATVDQTGLVTAVSPGRTVIYIITDDGNYYSTCKTEVTD